MRESCDSTHGEDGRFLHIGSYPYNDVKLLLDCFVEEGVSFGFSPKGDSKAPRSGGCCGGGTPVFVHPDDLDRALEIRQRVLKIEAVASWEEPLEEEPAAAEDDYTRCPKCDSIDVLYDSFSYHHSVMHFLIAFMPWKWKYKKWYCRKCWHVWEPEAK